MTRRSGRRQAGAAAAHAEGADEGGMPRGKRPRPADSGGDDAAAGSDQQAFSEFEAARAARIAANQARLAALELPQLAAAAAAAAKPKARQKAQKGATTARRRASEPAAPVRTSARARGQAPDPATAGGIDYEGRDGSVVLAAAAPAGRQAAGGSSSAAPGAPPGPRAFVGSSFYGEDVDATFLAALTASTASTAAAAAAAGGGASSSSACVTASELLQLSLDESDVAKLTKEGTTCVSFHPGTRKLLLAAADKSGQVTLWDVDYVQPERREVAAGEPLPYDGVLLMASPLHRDYVSSLRWLAGGDKLLTAAYDGAVRLLDAATGVWDVVGGLPDDAADVGWSAAEAEPDGASVLWLATSEGELTCHDMRAARSSARISIAKRKVNTLALHPDQVQLASSASDGAVCVWDVRRLEGSGRGGPQPLSRVGHAKSSQAAVWAPDGGRLLSVSFDDSLRLWAPPQPGAQLSAAGVVRHNTNTGRWVMPFRPAWAPGGDAVAVGCMTRAVVLYAAPTQQPGDGSTPPPPLHRLGELRDADHLTAIPSRLALHPAGLPVLAAATSSGRVHLWR